LFQRQAAGLLTYSFSLAVFPKDMFFSDIIASVKSLQQRELFGIFTRFPIEPCGTAYRLQRYNNLINAKENLHKN
jgi:hypothetical protein